MLDIRYTEVALKSLGKLDRGAARKVLAKIEIYTENPRALANQVKKLKGSGYLRLRVGDYRVIFSQDGIVMEIVKIGHRRDVYE